ncbi:hypothetical protein Ppa06_10830 [Planomonospora parontospora subsp. parontospora]|uniref:Uncharacterized protein n=2 Tax=Planomonospora parontospora TaxID=58119 RepID=A0AA37F319_9ACTN|nr:hypothetical protein [Planomonospora parontospora]GGK56167.1 hypothetical protein GCM10010126_14740 [Planomonospora parontospora]GII07285.1 hypothetical protein Ppa06_10830 [Planomonospora parontospora subsp. parontospora]
MLSIALVLAPIALAVVPPLMDQVEPKHVERFALRQGLALTPSNGDRVLTYIRVTRRWRSLGLVFGLLVVLAGFTAESIVLRPLPVFLGWFAGVLVAEVRLARARPSGRGDLGLRLVPPAVALLWAAGAVAAGTLACYGMVRYLRFGTDAAALPWAAGVATVVTAVPVLLRGLRTRPLTDEPADRVAAEIAARSRSAHVLAAGGAVAALWCGFRSMPPDTLAASILLVSLVVPFVALVMGTHSWRPVPRAHREHRWAAPATAVATVTAAVALGVVLAWSVPAPRSPDAVTWSAPEGREETSSRPIAHAALPECGTRLTFRRCAAWELFSVDEGPDDPGTSVMALQAATFAGRHGPLPRPAPFALSGDGFHAVYLHARTRRMVHQDLRTGVRHDLTGPLADAELPVPVLSHDGRHAALTTSGPGTGTTRLVSTGGGRGVEVPGIARVLGVGSRGFTAVTLPEGDKAELVTVGPDGAVRTRVPFDPAPAAGLFPDGRRLLVLTENGEAATVDPATGKTVRKVKIRVELSEFGDAPELLGWDAHGRFLTRLDLDDADDELRLVDPATGKASEAEGISLNESHRFPVLGKVDPW